MNDIYVTVVAVLAMLLFFSVIFNIVTEVNLRKTVKEWADEKDKTLEWKNKFEGLQAIKCPVTHVETFVVEPITFKNVLQLSDYISMDEAVKRKTIIDNLCRALADEILANPSFVITYEEDDPLTMSTKYMTKIRIVPFKEEV